MNDTIAAIASPPGKGSIGVIRLSGLKAYSIATAICKKKLKPRYVHFAKFYKSDDEVIDEGLVLYFVAPHSFTGEEVIEFQGHGSPVILDILLQKVLSLGARLARPGEFSERAFLNDKIDLTQAEAIADLIEASSHQAAQLAVRSLQGAFSFEINKLIDAVIHLRTYVEAAIDFPEEEVDFLSDGKVKKELCHIVNALKNILQQAKQGAVIQEGLHLVIAGKPNAGKSTLINQLAGKDVAIVTDIEGTTRDVMKELILLDGIPVHIIDTAGLRIASNKIEQEGINRARKEIKKADLVLLIIDGTEEKDISQAIKNFKSEFPQNIPVLPIINKVDKLNQSFGMKEGNIYLSAKQKKGFDALIMAIKQLVFTNVTEQEGAFLARRRHIDSLENAFQAVLVGERQLKKHKAGELLAEDLRVAQQHLSQITGEFNADDLLGSIFSNFCIGK